MYFVKDGQLGKERKFIFLEDQFMNILYFMIYHAFVSHLIILIFKKSCRMLIFLTKDQLKMQEKKIDPKVKIFYKICQQFNNPHKTSLPLYYDKISKKLQNNWPQFLNYYQNQMVRIKKSSLHWNFTDIRILKNCIKKSMQNQTLNILIKQWCHQIQPYLLQPMLYSPENTHTLSKLPINQKIDIIRLQIRYFCQFIFRSCVQLYESFFMRHFQGKQKQTKQSIIEKETQFFSNFIRNCLTNLECFQYLYHRFFIIIFAPNTQKQNPQEEFQKILLQKLGIQEKYQKLYQQTRKSLWDFHLQHSLENKVLKGPKVLQAIQRDHRTYFEVKKMEIKNQKETITKEILNYLNILFCPGILGSRRYIKMLLCMNQSYVNDDIDQNLIRQLQIFCLIWIDQKQSPKFQILLQSL